MYQHPLLPSEQEVFKPNSYKLAWHTSCKTAKTLLAAIRTANCFLYRHCSIGFVFFLLRYNNSQCLKTHTTEATMLICHSHWRCSRAMGMWHWGSWLVGMVGVVWGWIWGSQWFSSSLNDLMILLEGNWHNQSLKKMPWGATCKREWSSKLPNTDLHSSNTWYQWTAVFPYLMWSHSSKLTETVNLNIDINQDCSHLWFLKYSERHSKGKLSASTNYSSLWRSLYFPISVGCRRIWSDAQGPKISTDNQLEVNICGLFCLFACLFYFLQPFSSEKRWATANRRDNCTFWDTEAEFCDNCQPGICWWWSCPNSACQWFDKPCSVWDSLSSIAWYLWFPVCS